MIGEGADFCKVNKAFSHITEEVWRIFKERSAQAETKDRRQWGLDMRAKNIGCHNLNRDVGVVDGSQEHDTWPCRHAA